LSNDKFCGDSFFYLAFMKELFDFILRFGNLNQQQIDFITEKATEISIPKEEYFSEAGKIAKQVGFIVDGILRVCYYNNKSEEITKYFIEENNLVVDLESFDNQICSSAYVQAVTDCKIIIFERKDWLELLQTIVGFDAIVHKIISRALIQKVERRSPLVTEDATTRYLKFLEIYPTAVNKIPLSYVASYLGVTQSSLSRIRKNIRL
jgi:CRP-like cAMP-binding protein